MPAVDALLSRYGTAKLRDYVDQLDQPNAPGFQDNEDFIAEVTNYTRETLGPELGVAISDDLREMSQVLTANHHGLDTFAQSTQSNLLFSMRKKINGDAVKTIPVLACGSIPLNNLTYPRGFLIYASNAASGNAGICKCPLFPDSYKRKLVSVAGAFTEEMLSRSRVRAGKLAQDGTLGSSLESALNLVLDDFSSIDQTCTGYSRQATVANNLFWRRLFRDQSCPAELVHIELESIVSRLLEKDLFDKSAICHQLMFDPELRARLIENLDGERGCWQYEKLLQRSSGSDAATGFHMKDSAQGTMFFWGIDAKGRKIPLCFIEGENGKGDELRGIDDSGQLWVYPFTPVAIARSLQDGLLLPSIFTSYLSISIARGISCIGGYYQADYLPIMRKAVMQALRSNAGVTVKTINTRPLRPDLYLSGMQTIGFETDGHLLPAGPLEIMASGGLDADQYERIGEVSVLQAHIASLYDTIIDVIPQSGDFHRTKKEITKLVYAAVGSEIVTISMD